MVFFCIHLNGKYYEYLSMSMLRGADMKYYKGSKLQEYFITISKQAADFIHIFNGFVYFVFEVHTTLARPIKDLMTKKIKRLKYVFEAISHCCIGKTSSFGKGKYQIMSLQSTY